ncbi:MAG: PadR family transcriptional regulator [Chloroflexota bacterium]|nr:PadR family transcriptional regulator [Chloroflexota bacterium]
MKASLQTPLALSILSFLRERPMHPYEIKHMMRERRHDDVVKLRGGSLYSTIDRLEAEGLIVVTGTDREGRRPERTTYALTPDGEAGLLDWLRDSIATPVREYPHFGSMLAFLPHLMPSEAAALLRERVANLEAEAAQSELVLGDEFWGRLPRMFHVHAEYATHMRRAEIEWVRVLADDIEAGTLAWPDVIVAWHRRRGSWVEAEETDSRPP